MSAYYYDDVPLENISGNKNTSKWISRSFYQNQLQHFNRTENQILSKNNQDTFPYKFEQNKSH